MSINLKSIGMFWAGFGFLAYGGFLSALADSPNVAFYYGNAPSREELAQYDWIVVQADNFGSPTEMQNKGREVFAYVSVGEIEERFLKDPEIQPSWMLGQNSAWNSRVADLLQPGWRNYLLERRMADFWTKGYRAFFLDTLDSYQLAVTSPSGRAAQAQALADLILSMHTRFPGVKLLLNRGFEILPKVTGACVGVVAESLFASWNPQSKEYVPVKESDRAWLLGQLREVRERYRLPVIVIDYVAPGQQKLARQTALKIRALGFIPWIANPALDTLGAGMSQPQSKRPQRSKPRRQRTAPPGMPSIHSFTGESGHV